MEESLIVARLYVDFNTMTTDPKARVYINTQIQPVLAQDLRPGLVVTLYDASCSPPAGKIGVALTFSACQAQPWLRPSGPPAAGSGAPPPRDRTACLMAFLPWLGGCGGRP